MPESPYRSLFVVAQAASVAMLLIVPLQILVFVVVPMPVSVPQWLELFRTNPIIGMVHSDLLLLVNNILVAVMYLALYHLLKDTDRGLLQLSLVLGLLGIAAYLSSNKTFEWLALAQEPASSRDIGETLAVGGTFLLGWKGTAFDAYYVLNGLALLLIAVVMFRSTLVSRAHASFGLSSAVLMMVPSTAGTLGLVFSLLSLVPWYVFTILCARVFGRQSLSS